MLDSGAGCSVIDFETIKRLGIETSIVKSKHNLVDASGNEMKIIGSVEIKVTLPRMADCMHTFRVLDTNGPSNVLLGRDFMKKFGSVKFDFINNRVQLGNTWVDGLTIDNKRKVRLNEKVVIKARSEQIVQVRCEERLALLTGDYTPKANLGLVGVYASRARVIPNIDGVFQISLLNTTEFDITVNTRKIMGFIHPVDEVVSKIDQGSDTKVPKKPDLSGIKYGENLTTDEKSQLQSLVNRYEDIFAVDPKKPKVTTAAEHKIITGDALPVCQKTRRLPKAWEEEINEQIKDMVDKEIIRPSKSPWNSPILLVKKKDNSTRFVLDFRSLNDVTKKDSYPLPNIRDVIDKMEGAKYWTTLDAAAAYWSVPLAEGDKEKTAFAIPRGKFEFNVMPYGLCNAGATYQRMVDISLSGLPCDRVLAYMDDIVVFSRTFAEHLSTLESVFKRV